MAEAWELVLHYTFAGEPGVVFDHSPTRRSHGQPVNISSADFVRDGATPGSGAVRFHSPTSMIRVPPSESWRSLGGVRIEMICETELVRRGGTLAVGDSFSFHIEDGYFGGGFSQVGDTVSLVGRGGSEPRPLPTERWMTMAVQYDPSAVHAEINGEVVARWAESWNGLLAGSSGVVIGNDATGQSGLTGLVDDIKVWRLNPHFIGDKFAARPVDISVARCWADWSRTVDKAYASDPTCAIRGLTLLHTALFALMQNITSLPNIQAEVNEYILRYQDGWVLGRLDNVSNAVADLIAVLRRAGFDPLALSDVQALLNDQCFAALRERVPILCDAQFTEIFNISTTP